MHYIPVLDILDGHVVSAQAGTRHLYQPIHSPLCKSSHPIAVLEAFLAIKSCTFVSVYIADLNAIEKKGTNFSLIQNLIKTYPKLTFWIDSGVSDFKQWQHWQALGKVVIGSESINNIKEYEEIQRYSYNNFILSLDFKQEQFLGEPCLLENTDYWSKQLILMQLDRVGMQQGIDHLFLQKFSHTYPDYSFFAAGGVRHQNDVQQLEKIGITGALVATGLHQGTLFK